MTKQEIAEEIGVQIAIAQMMPANFGRLSVDAIAILWYLYNQPESSEDSMKRRNLSLGA